MFRLGAAVVLAASFALPASSQTTPGDVFPLDQGNRWVYLRTAWSSSQTSTSSSYVGAVEWLVDGMVEAGGESLPVLQITSGGTVERCAVGTEVDGTVYTFPFYGPDGTGACPVTDLPLVQVDVDAAQPVEALVIGGRTYTALDALYGYYGCGGSCDGNVQIAFRVGVLGFGYSTLIGGGNSFGEGWALRLADVGGETFGAPLDPGPGFFPLGVGDAWVFSVTTRSNGGEPVPDGFVAWTIDGSAAEPVLRVERVLDGVRTPLGACVAATEEASAANGYRQVTRLEDAPGAACPRDLPFGLPARDPTGLFAEGDGEPGVSVPTFEEAKTVFVGSQAVTTDVAGGSAYNLISPSGPVYRTAWSLGRDIGVLAFEASGEGPGFGSQAWTATLEYALVGGTTYGANPVVGEVMPGEAALSLAVGPNPARAAARLFIGGDATVRVTVLDALGRVVETREASPGTLNLDTSHWAAGVYMVRAETAAAVTSVRLTVAR